MSRRTDREEAAHRQYEAEHVEPRQGKSVVPYLIILVAAAFVLLLMAYLMQLRTADTVQGLHDSVNSVQTIDQLVVENRALREELKARETERDNVQAELDALKAQDHTQEVREKERQLQALNALNQLRALHNQGKHKDARALLEANPTLEADLTAAREALSPAQLEVYDPLDAYQRLVKLLG